jgi:hypothetical protein
MLIISLGLSSARGAEPSSVRIDFVNPKSFSDFRIQGRNEIASVPIFRDKVSNNLSSILAKRFPGKTLTLRFTDINLAGRIDQSRVRRLNNVRIEREGASPLRLEFDYVLADSNGKVLATGPVNLVDSDYLRRYVNYPISERSATLFYENETISRWLNGLVPSGSSFAGK